jgi:hypothetical protein
MIGCSGKVTCAEASCELAASSLDDGVVVGPGGFEAVGEFFYRLHTGAIPDEESYECCRQTADHPN